MTQTSLLSAASILAAEDIKFEVVEVPEWGGSVYLQQMNAEETRAFSKLMQTTVNEENGMFLMLIHSARTGKDGELVFTIEQLPELRKKNFDVLLRLQRIALRLNKMGAEGQEALKKDLSEAATVASPSS